MKKNSKTEKKIILGLTTTPRSDWKEKIKEIKRLKIKEISLFPTYLEQKERKILYKLLENSSIKSIPHVHLRDDMEKWEVDFFAKNFGAKIFNIHSTNKFLDLLEKIKKNRKQIFIENCSVVDKQFIKLAKEWGGFCFDVAHYHDFAVIQKRREHSGLLNLFRLVGVGCCHISAISKNFFYAESYVSKKMVKSYSEHYYENLKELDYVKKYVNYLPGVISLELENSFEEQLKAKKYLEKFIK